MFQVKAALPHPQPRDYDGLTWEPRPRMLQAVLLRPWRNHQQTDLDHDFHDLTKRLRCLVDDIPAM
jgi:hypothetical protein